MGNGRGADHPAPRPGRRVSGGGQGGRAGRRRPRDRVGARGHDRQGAEYGHAQDRPRRRHADLTAQAGEQHHGPGDTPAIKDGFYYDFDVEKPFTPEDLEKTLENGENRV